MAASSPLGNSKDQKRSRSAAMHQDDNFKLPFEYADRRIHSVRREEMMFANSVHTNGLLGNGAISNTRYLNGTVGARLTRAQSNQKVPDGFNTDKVVRGALSLGFSSTQLRTQKREIGEATVQRIPGIQQSQDRSWLVGNVAEEGNSDDDFDGEYLPIRTMISAAQKIGPSTDDMPSMKKKANGEGDTSYAQRNIPGVRMILRTPPPPQMEFRAPRPSPFASSPAPLNVNVAVRRATVLDPRLGSVSGYHHRTTFDLDLESSRDSSVFNSSQRVESEGPMRNPVGRLPRGRTAAAQRRAVAIASEPSPKVTESPQEQPQEDTIIEIDDYENKDSEDSRDGVTAVEHADILLAISSRRPVSNGDAVPPVVDKGPVTIPNCLVFMGTYKVTCPLDVTFACDEVSLELPMVSSNENSEINIHERIGLDDICLAVVDRERTLCIGIQTTKPLRADPEKVHYDPLNVRHADLCCIWIYPYHFEDSVDREVVDRALRVCPLSWRPMASDISSRRLAAGKEIHYTEDSRRVITRSQSEANYTSMEVPPLKSEFTRASMLRRVYESELALERFIASKSGNVNSTSSAKRLLVYPDGDVRDAVEIRVRDRDRLYSEEYLDDSIIDFYLRFLRLESRYPTACKESLIFNTFFFHKLKDSTGTSVGKWVEKLIRREVQEVKPTMESEGRGAEKETVEHCAKDDTTEGHSEKTSRKECEDTNGNADKGLQKSGEAQDKESTNVLPTESDDASSALAKLNSTVSRTMDKKHLSVFDYKYLFIPINSSSHWNLVVVCNANSYFDPDNLEGRADYPELQWPILLVMCSLGKRSQTKLDQIRKFLGAQWARSFPNDPPRVYTKVNLPHYFVPVPVQENSYDCGIFLLHYVELFCKEPPTRFCPERLGISYKWFSSSDLSMKRRQIAKLIDACSRRSLGVYTIDPYDVWLKFPSWPRDPEVLLDRRALRESTLRLRSSSRLTAESLAEEMGARVTRSKRALLANITGEGTRGGSVVGTSSTAPVSLDDLPVVNFGGKNTNDRDVDDAILTSDISLTDNGPRATRQSSAGELRIDDSSGTNANESDFAEEDLENVNVRNKILQVNKKDKGLVEAEDGHELISESSKKAKRSAKTVASVLAASDEDSELEIRGRKRERKRKIIKDEEAEDEEGEARQLPSDCKLKNSATSLSGSLQDPALSSQFISLSSSEHSARRSPVRKSSLVRKAEKSDNSSSEGGQEAEENSEAEESADHYIPEESPKLTMSGTHTNLGKSKRHRGRRRKRGRAPEEALANSNVRIPSPKRNLRSSRHFSGSSG